MKTAKCERPGERPKPGSKKDSRTPRMQHDIQGFGVEAVGGFDYLADY